MEFDGCIVLEQRWKENGGWGKVKDEDSGGKTGDETTQPW